MGVTCSLEIINYYDQVPPEVSTAEWHLKIHSALFLQTPSIEYLSFQGGQISSFHRYLVLLILLGLVQDG